MEAAAVMERSGRADGMNRTDGVVLPGLLEAQRLQPLAIQRHHAVRAGRYALIHRDPVDRLPAAQAEREGFPLVSLDPALAPLTCRLLW